MEENSAVIQWTVIENEQKKYDVITGYKVAVKNRTHFFDKITSSDSSSVTMNHLLPNTSYSVSVVGLGEEIEGMPSEWISFRTSGENYDFSAKVFTLIKKYSLSLK